MKDNPSLFYHHIGEIYHRSSEVGRGKPDDGAESAGNPSGDGMTYKKKLIEVALPLDAINKASARGKSIRHGHPSTLHFWWAGLEAPPATSTIHMTNHQPIINPLFVIINLAALAYLSLELLSETLLPILPAGKSSSNRQLIPLNRKPGGEIYRQSIDKAQESIDGEETNAPE